MENTQVHSKQKSKSAQWTDTLDRIFIVLAYEETLKGNRPGTSFNKVGWKRILDEFNKKCGKNYVHQQFKNRLSSLRVKWRAWDKLLEQTGFGWDPINRVVTADDDRWADYIKDHPEAAKFKSSTCPMYEEMQVIFGVTFATGWAASAASEDSTVNEDGPLHQEDLDSVPCTPLGGMPDDVGVTLGDDVGGIRRKRRMDASTSSQKSKKESRGDQIGKALDTLIEISKSRMKETVQLATTDDPFSMYICMKVLNEMEGIDQESKAVYKAIDLFTRRKLWREAFIHMLPNQRMGWLKILES